MHHIYTTKAIIIRSIPIGEANKYYFLLTEDLGFVRATAQSVRLDKSKLKGHLQDFCFVKISLVKGKDIWRITSVETIERGNFLKNTNKLIAIKNIFFLLLRLLHGEEKNEELFLSVESFYNFLLKSELSLGNIKNLETITVLRILYHLGYFKKTFDLSDFVKDQKLSIEILNLFDSKKKNAILDINNALNETHL
jgi:DNA repair protein RecO (recombination protein O)